MEKLCFHNVIKKAFFIKMSYDKMNRGPYPIFRFETTNDEKAPLITSSISLLLIGKTKH